MGFCISYELASTLYHDNVIKWKHFPRYWPFVCGIRRSPVNAPHKGLWRGSMMFSLICAWMKAWVNNREAGDLRRHCAHNDVSRCTRFCWFLFCSGYIIISLNSHDIFDHILQRCFAGISACLLPQYESSNPEGYEQNQIQVQIQIQNQVVPNHSKTRQSVNCVHDSWDCTSSCV